MAAELDALRRNGQPSSTSPPAVPLDPLALLRELCVGAAVILDYVARGENGPIRRRPQWRVTLAARVSADDGAVILDIDTIATSRVAIPFIDVEWSHRELGAVIVRIKGTFVPTTGQLPGVAYVSSVS